LDTDVSDIHAASICRVKFTAMKTPKPPFHPEDGWSMDL
jgi:hypothetical protein